MKNQFWSYEITSESSFKFKKGENYKLKKLRKKTKPYMKMDKKVFKFDDTEITEYEFHQYKWPILISDIDINKIVVFNNFAFVKINFKYSIG